MMVARIIADRLNHRLRRVTSAGAISTVAGNGNVGIGGIDHRHGALRVHDDANVRKAPPRKDQLDINEVIREVMPDVPEDFDPSAHDTGQCPACGEPVTEGATECPECGLALLEGT